MEGRPRLAMIVATVRFGTDLLRRLGRLRGLMGTRLCTLTTRIQAVEHLGYEQGAFYHQTRGLVVPVVYEE